MMQPLRLELFSDEVAAEDLSENLAWHEAAQAQYDRGYKAGLADAEAARDVALEEREVEITRAFQALEFTFHDARGYVLRSLAPLFEELSARLLPKIAQEGLPHLISQALLPLAEIATEAPVELVIHPSLRGAVVQQLARLPTLPVVLRDHPDQPIALVSLYHGERETRIDVQSALDAVDRLLKNFFAPPEQDARHG